MAADRQLYDSVQALISKLFEAEKRRLQAGVDRLVEQHQEIMNDARTGFMHNGIYYRHSKTKTIDRLPMLAWSLNDSMNKHLKDEGIIMLDCQQISQILFKLLGLATNQQEARDVLPDCIVSLVPQLSGLQRSRPVEDMIEHDSRLSRQYAKMLPKIQMYVVSRLLY